jgi:hypothetical protein
LTSTDSKSVVDESSAKAAVTEMTSRVNINGRKAGHCSEQLIDFQRITITLDVIADQCNEALAADALLNLVDCLGRCLGRAQQPNVLVHGQSPGATARHERRRPAAVNSVRCRSGFGAHRLAIVHLPAHPEAG